MFLWEMCGPRQGIRAAYIPSSVRFYIQVTAAERRPIVKYQTIARIKIASALQFRSFALLLLRKEKCFSWLQLVNCMGTVTGSTYNRTA